MIYRCCNENRKNAVLDNSSTALNGIDYLEVLDHDAPLSSPRQRTLLVHCLRAVPSTVTYQNVLITGGESITDITADWVTVASAPTVENAAEQTYFQSLPDAPKVLLIRTNAAGDFSPYMLRLVTDAATAKEDPFHVTSVLTGFDPQLAEIEFSFKVECGPDFDCIPQPKICLPDLTPPPPINYLAKDYSSFRQIMLDRLSQLLPGWDSSNEADIGMALAELIAYVGDHLTYKQDAIAAEAYMETARSRISLRRHAVLVDYHVCDGCNARAWMQIQVNGTAPVLLDSAKTLFYTDAPGRPSKLEGNESTAVLAGVQVFKPMWGKLLHPEQNDPMFFYTWGNSNCCLPKGVTEATLRGHLETLQEGDVLIFQEMKGPQTGDPADADLRHRCAVRLTHVVSQDANGNPLVDPLFDAAGNPITGRGQQPAPITEIQWSQEDALRFPLCISSTYVDDNGEPQPLSDVSVALGNVVLADHGLPFPAQDLPTVPNPSLTFPSDPGADRCKPQPVATVPVRYRPQLQDKPLTQAVPTPITMAGIPAPGLSAFAFTNYDADAAVPAITLQENTSTWLPQQDLLENGESDKVFVVEVESDGAANLRFGDDVNGESPASGTKFKASYRIGNGTAGNVGANTITKTTNANLKSVTNPLAASGGMDPQSNDQIRRRAPQAFLRQKRAITMPDYANIAEQNPGVDRAVASLRWTGSWYTVFMAVEPKGGGNLSGDQKNNLKSNVNLYRLAGQDLELDSPQYVPLQIALDICVDPSYFKADVQSALQEVLGSGITAGGRKGFFYPDNFTFGRTVYLSQIFKTARSVAGVISVRATAFQPQGIPATDQYLSSGEIPIGALQVAQLANDPSFPNHGRLTLALEGGK